MRKSALNLRFAACALSASVIVTAAQVGHADDWPQWRGLARNGISVERGWLSGWPQGQLPRVIWRSNVGKGHSAVSVSRGRAFTMGWDGRQDTVFCFDAATGRLIWRQSYLCGDIKQWPGPRATPTVDGKYVYTLGQHGQLRAWHADTGQPVWHRDLPDDYNPDVDYGFAWSPLVISDLIILNAGRRGLAVRTRDGSMAWGDDRQRGACTSPVPFEWKSGQVGVVVMNINAERTAVSIVGVEPRNGRELWRFDRWPEQWGAMGVDPIVHDGKIFLTSAQEHRQAARFSIAEADDESGSGTLRLDWSTNHVAGYTSGAVLWKGSIYLVDSNGILRCVDWETGRLHWSQRGFGERGSLIAADGVLLVQTGESGELVLVAAEAAAYRELRRMRVFEDGTTTFTAPVLASRRVYCRSYAGDVVCVDLNR